MLKRVDKILAAVGWVAAGIVVLMLFIGPQVVAEDNAKLTKSSAGSAMYGGGAGANGAAVFKANCGSCHTLSSAGTNGQVGPNLDNTSLSASQIEATVRSGRGAMPSFGGRLSDAEIKAVAAYVDAAR
jgi:mono/diheme cytochrome c family protein